MTAAAKNFNQLLTQTPSDFQRVEMAGQPTLDLSGFAGNPVAGYGVTDTWGTGYGVAGVSRRHDVLPATGSPLRILVNTHMCYMFSQINIYILVKLTRFVAIDSY
jgi:hypothetical protein